MQLGGRISPGTAVIPLGSTPLGSSRDLPLLHQPNSLPQGSLMGPPHPKGPLGGAG